jgi:hypothetical protein
MENTKFKRYFKKSFMNEATIAGEAPVDPAMDDTAAFAGSFEDDGTADQIQGEVEQASLPPEQRADLLKKADKYAENISKIILPTLRRLHDDIVSGVFASIAPDIKGISGINEDLAKLAESLRGRTRDAVLKSDKNEQK